MKPTGLVAVLFCWRFVRGRDEEKIVRSCYWPNEIYEPCFGGCAEVSCDNPRNHLRPCYPYCEPGCVCEDPYVRDDRTHQCVLPQDCSPTQMGIPIPTKRAGKPQPQPRYDAHAHAPRISHGRREPPELPDADLPPVTSNHMDDFRRGAAGSGPEVSRMGNYFNIVIAPPPIKALQPRKLLRDDALRGRMDPPKRI